MISVSDPCSAWTAKADKRVQFGYALDYLIDTENAVIVDVEATPARTYDEGGRGAQPCRRYPAQPVPMASVRRRMIELVRAGRRPEAIDAGDAAFAPHVRKVLQQACTIGRISILAGFFPQILRGLAAKE